MALTRRGMPAALPVIALHRGHHGRRPVWLQLVLSALAILAAGGCCALAIRESDQTRARWGDLLPVTSHAVMAVSGAAAAVVLAVMAVRRLVGSVR